MAQEDMAQPDMVPVMVVMAQEDMVQVTVVLIIVWA
jgi:hypothetical protein